MAKRESPFNCDAKNCTLTKGEGNHWLLVLPVHICGVTGAAILKWDDKLADAPLVQHACGTPHALTIQALVYEENTKGNTHDHPSKT